MRKIILALFGGIIRQEAKKLARETGIQELKHALGNGTLRSQVYVIHDDATNAFHEDLGISEERKETLDKALDKAIHKEKTFTMAIEKISKECENHQELAYICYRVGALAAQQHFTLQNAPMGLANLAMQPGSIESKLEQLAQILGVPKEMIMNAYKKFKDEHGYTDEN